MNKMQNYFICGSDAKFTLNSDYCTDKVELLVNACGINELNSLNKNYEMYRPSGRTDYLLMYVDEGECSFRIDNNAYFVPANSYILFKPGQSQYYSHPVGRRTRMFWIHFTGSAVEKLLKENNIEESFAQLFNKPIYLHSTIYKMIREFRHPTKFCQKICSNYLKIFLNYIGSALIDDRVEYIVNENLKKVIKSIEDTYNQNLPIDYYAKIYGCSINQFTNVFKKAFNCTPRVYITELRLSTAENLLLGGNMSVKKISESVGYDDSLYFSRIFKSKYGCSPKRFKELHVGG